MRIFWATLLVTCCGDPDVPMGRTDLKRVILRCNDGINQSAEDATPNQCAVATNVWAPNGRVETRPGYVGVSQFVQGTTGITTRLLFARAEDTSAGTFTAPSGAGVLTLNNLVGRVANGGDMDRWYLGFSSTFGGVRLSVPGVNTNTTKFRAEYWDGSVWTHIRVTEFDPSLTEPATTPHLGPTAGAFVYLLFVTPQDWATTTIDSQSAYWLRFNLLEADFDAAVSIDVDSGTTAEFANVEVHGIFAPQFSASKRYLTTFRQSASSATLFFNAPELPQTSLFTYLHTGETSVADEPATLAVVPQFDEAFLAYNHRVTHHVAQPTDGDVITGLVETGDFAVGTDAPYDPALIPSLAEFPRAKYITFFKGRLWASGIEGEPFTVRWGAPQPYHKVWPATSYEILAEHDNSRITGQYPLGEYMVFFKNDSIWMAYDAGLDEFGVQQYALRQVVAGVGCVSQSSIKAVRGNLIFLAEDGLYRFDGSTASKVSIDKQTGADRLVDFWPSITAARRPFAAAAHWKTQSTYLLSVTTDGSGTNNETLVWDYDSDALWLWDNIDAQHWIEDEANNDNETLYFGDSQGNVYQFGVGKTDHGATISATLTTARLDLSGPWKKRVRYAEAMCTNKTRAATVELLSNDQTSGTSASLSFTDSVEKDWTSFTFGTDSYTPARRVRKRADYRKDYEWLQVKISNSTKNQPLQLSYVELGMQAIGGKR